MMDHPACFQLDELGRYTSEFSTLLHHNSKETPAHASSSPPRLQDPARSTHLTALNNGSFPSHPPHFPQQQQQQGEPARELLVEGTVEDLGPILAGLTELSKRTKANAQAKLGLLSPHPPGSAGRHSADVERLQGFKNQLHHLQDSLLKSAQKSKAKLMEGLERHQEDLFAKDQKSSHQTFSFQPKPGEKERKAQPPFSSTSSYLPPPPLPPAPAPAPTTTARKILFEDSPSHVDPSRDMSSLESKKKVHGSLANASSALQATIQALAQSGRLRSTSSASRVVSDHPPGRPAVAAAAKTVLSIRERSKDESSRVAKASSSISSSISSSRQKNDFDNPLFNIHTATPLSKLSDSISLQLIKEGVAMGEDVEGGGGGGGGISLGRRYLERLKEEERARAKKISMARIRNQVKASRAARDDSDNEVKEEDEGEREEESPLSSYPFEQLLLRHERGHSSKIHKEESLVRAVDGSESGLSSGAARTGTEYEELYAKYLEKQLELDESLRKREGGSGLGGTGGGAGGGDAGGETGEEGRERGEVASLEIKLKESTYELSRVQNELLLAQSALAQSEEEAKRLRKEAMQLKEEGLSGSCINCQTWSTKIAQVKAEAQDSMRASRLEASLAREECDRLSLQLSAMSTRLEEWKSDARAEERERIRVEKKTHEAIMAELLGLLRALERGWEPSWREEEEEEEETEGEEVKAQSNGEGREGGDLTQLSQLITRELGRVRRKFEGEKSLVTQLRIKLRRERERDRDSEANDKASDLQSQLDRLIEEYGSYRQASEREVDRAREDARRTREEGMEREVELEERMVRMRKECQALEEALEAREKEMLEAQDLSRSLQLELSTLRRKTRDAVQLDEENERLRSDLEATKESCMELEAKLFAVTLSNSIPSSPSPSRSHYAGLSPDKMTRIMQEKDGLEADLARMYEQLHEERSKVVKSREECAGLRASLSGLGIKLAACEADRDLMKGEIEVLRSNLSKAENLSKGRQEGGGGGGGGEGSSKVWRDVISRLEEEREVLLRMLEEAREDASSLRGRIEELERELLAQQQQQQPQRHCEGDQSLPLPLTLALASSSSPPPPASSSSSSLHQQQQQPKSLFNDGTRAGLEHEVKVLRERIEWLEPALREERSKREEEAKAAAAECERLRGQRDNLKDALSELERESGSMHEKQGGRERELEGLLNEARRQAREARDKLDALEASHHDTESKLRSALRDVQSLNQQVNDLARDNLIHIEKHEAVRDELTRTKEALKLAGDEGADAAALRVKSKNLQDKIDLLEQLMEQAKGKHEAQIESKDSLIRSLERDLASSSSQLVKLQQQVATLENELASATSELDLRRGEQGSQHEVMKRRLVDYEDKMAALKAEVEELKGQRDDYEAAISSLEESNGALAAQANALSISSSESRSRIVELQQLVHRQEEQLESLQGPTSSHARVRDLEAAVYRAQQQISGLQKGLSLLEEEKSSLVNELREREEELMGAEGKVTVLRAEVNRLSNFDHA